MNFNYNDSTEPYFYLEDAENSLNRTHILNEAIFSNEEIQLETYMFTIRHIDYISNYVFPFWKSEFLFNNDSSGKQNQNISRYNPYATWSNTEIAKHYIGLKDNTRCFELKMSDITIGFATLLILDEFDCLSSYSVSQFSNEIYKDSLFFYNFVIEKAFRSLGYGKIMLEQILKYTKENYAHKYKFLVLAVDKNNIRVQQFYYKFHFKFIGNNPINLNEYLFKYNF
jgi:GNAT superfamily N-acetyltransferase